MTDQTPDLDALFEAAKQDRAQPSGDLLARVMADADHVQSSFEMVPETATETPRHWGIWDFFGTWQNAGALASFAILGVAFGFLGGETSLITDTLALAGVAAEGTALAETTIFDAFDPLVLEY